MIATSKRMAIDMVAVVFVVTVLSVRGPVVAGDRGFAGRVHGEMSALATNVVIVLVGAYALLDLVVGFVQGGSVVVGRFQPRPGAVCGGEAVGPFPLNATLGIECRIRGEFDTEPSASARVDLLHGERPESPTCASSTQQLDLTTDEPLTNPVFPVCKEGPHYVRCSVFDHTGAQLHATFQCRRTRRIARRHCG